MATGKIKCFRCGNCGSFCTKNSKILTSEQIKVLEPFVDWNKATLIWCDICINEEEIPRRVQVTHDMAIDAGYPEMEGMWIDW